MIKNDVIKGLLLGLALIVGISCASVDKMALNSTSRILENGASQVNEEPDWHFFKEAAPANIKMIEGMAYADDENPRFLGMLAKAYGGYAFGIHETLYLDDYLGDSPSEFHKQQAISSYTKGLNYGLKYLEVKGIDREEVFSKDAAKRLPKLFKEELSEKDMTAIFYTAQSLGGLINLQKNNVELISRIGAVKAMMDWVCGIDMEFEYGACHLFYAMYESARPAMLGGDLEKGKALFKKHMEMYPQNLLGRVTYLQYYVIPMMDEIEYASEREFLIRELNKWKQVKNAGVNSTGAEVYLNNPQYNLFNAIANERFNIIERHKKDIF